MGMREQELFDTIHEAWIQRLTERLTSEPAVSESLRGQLDQLCELLSQSLDSGSPNCLDDLLEKWVAGQTQTDPGDSSSNLIQFIRETLLATQETALERLPPADALRLIAALNPCFAHAFEQVAQLEMQSKVRHLSDQLIQVRQALEKFDRTKSDFIAVAAHELKTPLTLVEGYAAMLRETMERAAPGQLTLQLMAGINNGTQRLKAIIDDMIDVSLIDNNLMTMNFQPFWLNRLFSILRLELNPVLAERHMLLDIADFPGSSEMNYGDPERLLQVLRNVLTNAIKYTPDEGEIRVDGRSLPGFVEVTVSDTGIGIAAEDLPVIFEKFTRLGSTALHSSGRTKFKGGGPGLGLHIARGIVEAHGGAIWVESPGYDEQAKPGSTFHILLPVRKTPPDDKMAKLFAPLGQKSLD